MLLVTADLEPTVRTSVSPNMEYPIDNGPDMEAQVNR